MGWTYTSKRHGESVKEFFAREFSVNGECRLVDMAVVKMRTAYGAYRSQDGNTIGLVCLLDYRPSDLYSFGYKDMDECRGPRESECPERILKLLSPLPDVIPGERDHYEHARNWRARCWANIEARRGAPSLHNGCRVQFSEPIRFTNGQTLDTFTIKTERGKVYFYDGYLRYRLGDWRKRQYMILPAAA